MRLGEVNHPAVEAVVPALGQQLRILADAGEYVIRHERQDIACRRRRLDAVFQLEHGHNSDDGTATATFWNRQTYVGLAGGWGELLLGRQYTPTFLVHATYDAFGPQGVAAQQVLRNGLDLLGVSAPESM